MPTSLPPGRLNLASCLIILLAVKLRLRHSNHTDGLIWMSFGTKFYLTSLQCLLSKWPFNSLMTAYTNWNILSCLSAWCRYMMSPIISAWKAIGFLIQSCSGMCQSWNRSSGVSQISDWDAIVHMSIAIEILLWHWVSHLSWHGVEPSTLTCTSWDGWTWVRSSLSLLRIPNFVWLILWCCEFCISGCVIMEIPSHILFLFIIRDIFWRNVGARWCLMIPRIVQCWSLILRKHVSYAA